MSDHTSADDLVETPDGPLSRRAVLAAGGVATASAALLAASCSTYTPSGGNSAAPAAEGAPSNGSGAADAAVPAQAGGTPLGPTSSVPVGGGKVFTAQKVVVTQPTAGQFKAFSAVCTHKGCTVNKVSDGTIDCPCHNSKFNITDGSVEDGPAKQALPGKNVSAAGGTLHLS